MMMVNKKTVLLFLLVCVSLRGNEGRPRIGLVLSGGGARGFAHVGILKMLDSLDIPIDYIAGTSMGGIAGALYAIGYSGKEIERLSNETDWLRIFTDKSPRNFMPYFEKKQTGKHQLEFGFERIIPSLPSGLIVGQKISQLFATLTYPYTTLDDFDDLPIPFRCVAADLITGDEVVLGSGSLAEAMRTTMSIPSIFSPVESGGRWLVDGGELNNLPVDVVKAMGADIVIAVDVMGPQYKLEKSYSVIDVLEHAVCILAVEKWRENVEQADILIRPDLDGFTVADFFESKVIGILKNGDKAAKQHENDLIHLKSKYQLHRNHIKHEDCGKDNQFVVTKIEIYGNEKLSAGFICRLAGLHSGQVLNLAKLNNKITRLFGCGYFESVRFQMHEIKPNQVFLKLIVKESSFRRLKLGARYDNYYNLIGRISILTTNFPLTGFRSEHELLFAGLTRWHSKLFYPSQMLNLPVYPFAQFGYQDIPKCVFNTTSGKIARYKNRSFHATIGFGLLLFQSVNMGLSYGYEWMNVKRDIVPSEDDFISHRKDRLTKFQFKLDVDTIDDVLLPQNGFLICGCYERQNPSTGSDVSYEKMSCSVDFYRTFLKRHNVRLYGFCGTSSGELSLYQYHDQGRPEFFVGQPYDRMVGESLSIFRIDYRLTINRFFYWKMMVNTAINVRFRTNEDRYDIPQIWGFGAGLKLHTPFGNVEAILGWGDKNWENPKSKQLVGYISVGVRY